MQGQLHHTERQYGLFVLWTNVDIKITLVFRDDNFWNVKMEPKLTKFYFDCLLPEIVDGRVRRSMEIREPDYVLKNENHLKAKTVDEKVKAEPTSAFLTKTAAKKRESAKRKIQEEMEVDCCFKDGNDAKKRKITPTTDISISDNDEVNILPDNWKNEKKNRKMIMPFSFNDIEIIEKNVLDVDFKLTDIELDTFLALLGEKYPNFEFISVLNISVTDFITECTNDKDLQIVGGNIINYWRAYHYTKNRNKLIIYDSLNCMLIESYDDLKKEEKEFISKRYPTVKPSDVSSFLAAQQQDGTSCGVYSAAVLVSLLLGIDLRKEDFSLCNEAMRRHFVDILKLRQKTRFPNRLENPLEEIKKKITDHSI